MNNLYKIKKGLNLKLAGAATKTLEVLPMAEVYAVQPADFYGLTPRVAAKEGEHVDAGQAVFTDKADERICMVAPVSGVVKKIVRGERRKILRAEIVPDEAQQFKVFAISAAEELDRERLLELLLSSGLFAFFRQRPYDVTPSPSDTPKAIFLSAFSAMPLATDFSYVLQGQEADFQAGISALAKLAPVYVGLNREQGEGQLAQLKDAEVNIFDGPNPAGCVGVQINKVWPVNKGEVVWTLGAEVAIFIGRLLRTGHVDLRRRIAVGGGCVIAPRYVETQVGTPLSAIYDGRLRQKEHIRLIDGNPLVGRQADVEGFLGALSTETCALREGDDADEVLGWAMPRLKQFSMSRSYFSWLMGKNRTYDLDCRVKGGKRHMIMSGEYDRVFPMDIYAEQLVKAVIAGDIDRQEALGIYEVAPEDFALSEFVCSSKLPLQDIIRRGLDALRRENA